MLHPGSLTLPLASANSEAITQERRPSFSELERLTCITGISRAQIGGILAQVHGPWLLHLGARERIVLLEAIAAMYGALGYLRKEAYILREVLGCIMDLLVCGRDEALSQRTASAGSDVRERSITDPVVAQGTVGIRENESAEGNESVLHVIKHVCRVHGIDLEAVKLVESSQKSLGSGNAVSDDSTLVDLGDVLSPLEPFGWPELQIGIIREVIAAAEALPGELAGSIMPNDVSSTLFL